MLSQNIPVCKPAIPINNVSNPNINIFFVISFFYNANAKIIKEFLKPTNIIKNMC